ncbi:capping protein-inhibiting regulator of actin dynamics [Centropristis striata]|uniref:capping protein-inhibiting regulator of actin dynamics n=1 Tax=Centropristis striata TaxID=184440 RepID=UPI0027DEDE2F|nr:capping protein-inhibiting regulator of actin dynamics [Centropristis striata]
MESFSGDTEESTEDIPGRKKSKLKSLKTRLFGRSKRGGEEGDAKLSQSASDITAGKGLGSEEDLACSQGMMGSRALSHDSIFLADQDILTDAEPARVLSQENVHSKIKALQIKLQQQKMHLGPPPMVLPVRRPEERGSRSEDDSVPHSPSEISGALSKTSSQPSSRPLSPIPKPAPTKPLTPSLPLSVSSNSSSSAAVEAPLDFSSPVQFTPCLDTSAARHRMSVKPRNQRASTKKTPTANDSKSHLQTLNNINPPESVREEEQQLNTQEEVILETEQSPEVAAITSEVPKSSGLEASQQDQNLPGRMPSASTQVLRVKPPRPADAMPSERPHSSYISSEVKDKREDFEIQVLSHDKRNTVNKAEVSSEPVQRLQGETNMIRGIKRPTTGAGSFHFSITTAKNRDAERPRSGSFVGVLGPTEVKQRTVGGAEDKPFTVGRLRQEGALHKSPVLPWDRKDSLKTETESSQEVVEEAAEAQEVEEDEGKTAFGVKLRSTSLSVRLRSEASTNSKPPVSEEQCDNLKKQDIRDIRLADPTPPGLSLPLKHNLPSTGSPHIMETETTSSNPKEVETAVAGPQQPQPSPQTASSEVSWMSMAMEKTRSLQQLFTSRFPRDFTGAQTAARPQAQVETQTVKTQQSTTTHEAANQPSNDAVKAETVQSRSQAQTVKPSVMAVQQKTSLLQANACKEPQTLKQSSELQSASHPAVQTSPWTAQYSAQTDTSSQSTQGSATQSLAQSYLSSGQQQPPWSNRGFQPATQLKSTTSVSTTSSASAPPTVSALGRGEREATVQEKEGASQTGRRAVWAGSVSGKAAFLEKRAEWTAPPGTKGVELKKAQTEVQTSDESSASIKPTPLSRDIKPEGKQGVSPSESSPTKVPDRPREEKWLRKNMASPSSRSSSPTMPSALQSMSDSGQPSWMELAKRKSMAWSDKSMD